MNMNCIIIIIITIIIVIIKCIIIVIIVIIIVIIIIIIAHARDDRDLLRQQEDIFREFRTWRWVPAWPRPENCRLLALDHLKDILNAIGSHTASVSRRILST